MTPYYNEDGITIYHGDCREVLPTILGDKWGDGRCVVLDPPWDQPELAEFVAGSVGLAESLLVFTDGRRFADPIRLFGAPSWVFTWDTMNTWTRGPRAPVQQTKHALWYGESFERDAELWGEPPPHRAHPTTHQEPLDGRRLTDLWRESIRWLHTPSAGKNKLGTERFGRERSGDDAYRHAKPVGWMRCLIGDTSTGAVVDPFLGSGASLEAARDLGRSFLGIEIEERYCEIAAQRLAQGVLDFDEGVGV